MKLFKPLYFFGVIFIITCKISNKDNNSEISNNKNENLNSQQPTKLVQNENEIKNIEIKISNNEKLTNLDLIFIDSFLTKNKDESKFEEIGYLLFEYLKKNKKNNFLFSNYLKTLDYNYQENFVHRLIKIMCIDISDDNYTYEKFIIVFELFKDYTITEKSIKECLSNNIQ